MSPAPSGPEEYCGGLKALQLGAAGPGGIRGLQDKQDARTRARGAGPWPRRLLTAQASGHLPAVVPLRGRNPAVARGGAGNEPWVSFLSYFLSLF